MENYPKNHGAMWRTDDVVFAAVTLARGMPLNEVAAHLGRKADAVEGKLERCGVYFVDSNLSRGYDYVYGWRSNSPLKALKRLRSRLHQMGHDAHLQLEEAIQELEQTETKENTMTEEYEDKANNCMRKPLFEKIAPCRGRNIAHMSDEELLRQIAEVEGEIAKFEATKTRPKRLQTRIDAMKAELAELVAYLDSLE